MHIAILLDRSALYELGIVLLCMCCIHLMQQFTYSLKKRMHVFYNLGLRVLLMSTPLGKPALNAVFHIVSMNSGVANWIIGGGGVAHIHILEFTDHENNRFQTKLTVQNMNIWICAPPPPQLLSLLRHCPWIDAIPLVCKISSLRKV